MRVPARAAGVLVPAALYGLLGLLRLAPVWRAPNTLVQCGCGDPAFTMFYLGWTPYAVTHGHDPFFTDWLFFPSGVNTMWNVTLPLPGLLLAPLTWGWGVVLSYNVLVALAFAGSALSAYLVLRRWAPWRPAAFAGGLLYGFSPYMVGQGLGHAHMLLLALVPVLLLLLDEVLVRQRRPVWESGPLLGAAAVAQLLTAEEVLAGAALVGALGLVVLVVLFRDGIRARWRRAAAGLALAAGTALVLALVPLVNQLTGPQRLVGTVNSPDQYHADLLSWVVPSRLVKFAPAAAVRFTDGFSGNPAENGSYLGVPLLLAVVAVAVLLWRRRPVVRWAVVLLVVVMVLALGPSLSVGGDETGVPLPFQLVHHLPLLESLISVRLSSYAVLLCAFLLAVGLDALHQLPVPRWRPRAAGLVAGLAAVVALLPLLPAQLSYAVQDAGVPPWFRSAAAQQRVPAGSVLVTVPAATPTDAAAMVWQAEAGYRFKVPFGYSLHPDAQGTGRFPPEPSKFLTVVSRVGRGTLPVLSPADIVTMRTDLARWQVRTIVVTMPDTPQRAAVLEVLGRVTGRAPEPDTGAWVWYGLDPAALDRLPAGPALRLAG
ncbi:MAG TPA: hypothetical protein VLM05_12670 [Mycobacteriales bacterium]|nr:hypothetical protein [Mycobacteriales bacterium]